MRRLILSVTALALLAVALPLALNAGEDPQSPEEMLSAADAFRRQKTYKSAVELYAKFLKASPDDPRRLEVHHSLAESMLGLRQRGLAIQYLEQALKREAATGDDVDRARLLSLSGRTVGQYHGGSAAVVARLDEAIRIFDVRAKAGDEVGTDRLTALFGLAQTLGSRWQYGIEYEAWKASTKDLPTKPEELDEAWQKYREAETLRQDQERRARIEKTYATILESARGADAARARFLLGAFRLNATGGRGGNANLYPPTEVTSTPEFKEAMNEYVTWVEKAIVAWTKLAKEHPRDALAPEATFFAAWAIHHHLNDFPRAVKAYRAFIASYPRHERVSDARKYLFDLEKEDIVLDVQGPFATTATGGGGDGTAASKNPRIGLSVRNTGALDMALYRIDPRARLDGGDDLSDATRVDVSKLTAFHRWDLKTGAPQDHTGVRIPLEIPTRKGGLWLVVAKGTKREARAYVVISDLAIVERVGMAKSLVAAMNAESGAPRGSVDVRMLAIGRRNRQAVVRKIDGRTDDSGQWRPDLTALYKELAGWTITTVATSKDDVAISRAWYRNYDNRQRYRVLTHTDRPVYRPGQTMRWKATVRRWVNREGIGKDDYVVAGDQPVTVKIHDVRNQVIYDKTLITNEDGSISGDLELGEEPPLGVYQIRIFIGGRQYYTSGWTGASFRVEEYKKPEFEVNVSTSAGRVKSGERVTAKIDARYYFGAPVANADVAFTVHRIPFAHHWFPEVKYRWYHGFDRMIQRWDWQRELITQGTGKTDADGRLEIAFDSKDHGDRRDSKYVVEAKVVDASRREIAGSGMVYATAQPYFLYVEPERRIYRPGDRAKLELHAMTASNAPVATTGELIIERRRDVEEDGKRVEKWDAVAKVAASTDETGDGLVEFIPDRTGAFRFSYVVQAEKDLEVRAAATLWIASDDFRGADYRFRDVSLHTDKRSYAEGDVLKLLVNTAFEDAHVLLSFEADGHLLDTKMVKTTGKSVLLELPVTEAWAPNLFVKAVFIRGGELFADQIEVLVPPADRFLDVSVTGGKAEYRPGEKATFTVSIKDADGKPVATETSLTMFDKSLLYIQPVTTPDIREFFYGQKRADKVRFSSSIHWRFAAADRPLSGTDAKYRLHGTPRSLRAWTYSWDGLRVQLGREMEHLEKKLRGRGGSRPGAGGGDFGAADGGAPAPSSRSALKGGAPNEVAEDRAMDKEEAESGDNDDWGGDANGGGGADPSAPRIRSNFADSAYWNAHLVTDDTGTAEIEVTMPDSLTTWVATARAISRTTAVGAGTAEPVVTKRLLIRLAAPRFFSERDEVVISGLVRNDLDTDQDVRIALEVGGRSLELMKGGAAAKVTASVSKGTEKRIDWRFKVVAPGDVTLTASARTDVESDAVRRRYPALQYGTEKFEARVGSFVRAGGVHEGDASTTVSFTIPKARDPRASRLEVTVSASLASVMLESLPYLADYPYGCTEQTLNRFVPSVVAKKTLRDLGVNVDTIDVPEVRGVPGGFWGTPQAQKLKVLRAEDLDAIVKAGLDRLYDFQHADGSWGWWKQGSADDFMTALVLHGLVLAREADVAVDEARLKRAAGYLLGRLHHHHPKTDARIGDDAPVDSMAQMSFVLLRSKLATDEQIGTIRRLVEELFELRDRLASTGRAHLALGLNLLGDAERASILLDNLTDHALVDAERGTARFGRVDGYRSWRDDAVEGTAWTLQAYLAVRPKSELVPKMMLWLTRNRRGAHWASTRDTATATLALADYLRRTRELDADVTATVTVGSVVRSIRLTRANLLTADDRVIVSGDQLVDGKLDVQIAKSGKGNLYYSAYLTTFTKEDEITAAGNEIAVERRYHRLVPKEVEEDRNVWVGNHWESRKVKVIKYDKILLESGATLESGDLVEVELRIESGNDYRYLAFEDYKLAGCEPVALRSGFAYGGVWSNMELRDEKVVFFAPRLPQTTKDSRHTLTYRVRCEVPGRFHAMPVRGWAMYLPEVRATSDLFRLSIEDPTMR